VIGANVKVDTSGFVSVVSEAKTRGITLKGVKAGIRILQTAAKTAAPRRARSGALRRAQGVKARKGWAGSTTSYAVQGARVRVVNFVRLKKYRKPVKVVPANYDHLVLGGTRPHRLGKGERLRRPKTKRRKRRNRKTPLLMTFQTTGGKHPGTKPNPYRKRAWERVKRQVGREVMRVMRNELIKVVNKERRKLRAA
jgi:hypothetical protein